MSNIEEYLPPFINSEKISHHKINELVKDVVFGLKHSLKFHERLQDPSRTLPEINADSDKLYETSKEIYDESNKRIDKLEEKSFKLLSYYTLILGGVSFVIAESNLLTISKILLTISIVFIIWSIVISFRCLNIKGIYHKYITDIYDFGQSPPQFSFSKGKIILSHLNSAIKNDRISDNVVDLHKAARHCLIISSIIFVIAILFAFTNGELLKKDSTEKSINIANKTEIQLENISKAIENQSKNVDYGFKELKYSIDTLSKNISNKEKSNINKK